ncbi:A-agglutinin anchorage subunit-like [Strongylocentrotus purpuratus]|uniref:Sushi domain-containing protein n=1 Tax=Strongylocentrotus purpuratus TaxID=7668 RepID=A0A7M7N189_STRPU|nr:A-agglutinin anchorage subunit-like [Strongylocentrotus purpuratus]
MSSPSSTPSSTEPVTVPSTGTSASNPQTESMSTSSLSSTPSPTGSVTVPSTGTSASNPQTESMSTSSLSSTPSPTGSAIECTVPMDVADSTCDKPGTNCSFKCSETGDSVRTVTCNATGSWKKGLPNCGK